MTANEDINNEANCSEKNVQDAQDPKSNNSVAEKVELLSSNQEETLQEIDDNKTVKQESDKKENNINNNGKKMETHEDKKLVIQMSGFTRLKNETEQLKLYHSFFTKEIGISAPLVEMSAGSEDFVIFQLKSEDDKKTIFSKIKKRKIYKWRNCNLEMKVLSDIPSSREYEKLPLEAALHLLYPYKEVPYGNQVKEKTEMSNNLIHSILPEKLKNVKAKPIVSMPSVEGYDYNVPLCIEEDSETKILICGIRVITADKKRTCIVPINMCLNVPHQIALVAKDFVDHMPDFGFTPFNPKTCDGNILGIILQMTLCGNFIMTMVIPTTKLEQFKQLTPDGVDGDVITVQNSSKSIDTRESMIEKADMYYKNRGKDHGIMSVYLCIVKPRSNLSWSVDNSLPDAHHVLGDSTIPNSYNGHQIRVMWAKDYLINNSLTPILNIIHEWGYINSSSSVYLVCNHKIVALYIASRVEKLTMLCSTKRGKVILMKAWAKKMGLNKINFIGLKGGRIRLLPEASNNATAVIWHKMKQPIIDGLLAAGIGNIIFVSYWKKDTAQDFIQCNREIMEFVLTKLEIVHIFPIDIAPYTDRLCLMFFFRAKKHLLTRKRSYDSLEGLTPYYHCYEEEQNRAKRSKMAYF